MIFGERNPASDDRRYILVQRKHRYGYHRALKLAAIALLIALVASVLGFQWGLRSKIHALQETETLENQLEEKGTQVESMRSELAVHKHGNEVERQVSEHLRLEIVALQNRLLEHEQSIAFYKGILEPRNTQGLSIHSVALSQKSVSGRFSFKIVLVQPLDSAKEAAGSLVISVSGLQAGKKQRIEWSKLSGEAPVPRFRFKVYQDITGELVLPESFMPESIALQLKGPGIKADNTTDYPWKLKEAP